MLYSAEHTRPAEWGWIYTCSGGHVNSEVFHDGHTEIEGRGEEVFRTHGRGRGCWPWRRGPIGRVDRSTYRSCIAALARLHAWASRREEKEAELVVHASKPQSQSKAGCPFFYRSGFSKRYGRQTLDWVWFGPVILQHRHARSDRAINK